MNREFPKSIREIPTQIVYIFALAGFILLSALLYEPRTLNTLLRTGESFHKIGDMFAFNLAISFSIIVVSMAILRVFFIADKERLTTNMTIYSLWCAGEAFVTSAFLALYFCLIGKRDPSSGNYFAFLVDTTKAYVSLAVIPYIILNLLYALHDSYASEPLADDTRIRFYDSRHLLRFATTVSSILYIEAEENYIRVNYLENGIPKMMQIRNTMKSLEPMCETGSFVRVHRSFIVNPKHVKQLRKDPDGFFFADMDVETAAIPVSKRYQKSLDAIL